MARILIIEDDPGVSRMMRNKISEMGYATESAATLLDGVRMARASPCDVVLLDVNMPDGNGLDVLWEIREAPWTPEIIVMTGYGEESGAERAIRNGAWDYVQKPVKIRDLKQSLADVLRFREKQERLPASDRPVRFNGVIGKCPKMALCLHRMAQAAVKDVSVLITGETGCGKELFARAIHDNSPRSQKPFVVVDCAALPEKLVESILFGHVRGAFTGAERDREGLIRQADGGTLFLDEVGELPLHVQRSFLRFLQERNFRPLGGKTEIRSDFRLLTATHRNLDEYVAAGTLREDFLHRIRTITLNLPPLRERLEDLEELVRYCIAAICRRTGMCAKEFSPGFFDVLRVYEWPGNLRELSHAIESAVTEAGDNPVLFSQHLPEHIRVKVARASVVRSADEPVGRQPAALLPKLADFLDAHERRYLIDLLSQTGGDIRAACRVSGLSRSRLYVRLKKHDITRHF